MAVISVNPEELRRQAAELERLRQQHLDAMRRLRIIINSLSDVWQGEAQTALVSSFLAKSRTMNELASVLEKYIKVTEQAADEAEAADRALLVKVNRVK